MKLYYSGGTSSMSCVVAVEELGVKCELIEVSWSKNLNVEELNKLNPLGTVPTLVTDDGKVMTQNTAVLEYLAEAVAKNSNFLPATGTWERINVIRWLAFTASDFHKAFTVSFRAEDMATDNAAQGKIEEFAKMNIIGYLTHLDTSLKESEYIAGSNFTVADCYLVVVLGWCSWLEIDVNAFLNVERYLNHATKRTGVKSTLTRQ